jgi:Replication-relaxation
MCRGCRITPEGIYCPPGEVAPAGPGEFEPRRVHWSALERRWRSEEEVAAELAGRRSEEERRRKEEERRERERLQAEQAHRRAEEQVLERLRRSWPPPALDEAPGDGYQDAHRYQGVLLSWGERGELRKPVVPTIRDVDILHALWRHRVLSTAQLKVVWWRDASLRKAQERMKELCDAGYVDKFRPPSLRGSYQWTYCLANAGHELLANAGRIPRSGRFRPRAVGDFPTVLHALQLNAWVIAHLELLGERLLDWRGEPDSRVEVPDQAKKRSRSLKGVRGLARPWPQPIWPDAALEIARSDGGVRTLLIEFDRTQRPDKNQGKFLRYDCFLTWWWEESEYGEVQLPPLVLFICQDERSLEAFVRAADAAFTGSRWASQRSTFPARDLVCFGLEADIHRGSLRAWRVPDRPPGDPNRGEFLPRPARLPGNEAHDGRG